MSNWERQYLGLERFPKVLTAVEVEQFFTLTDEEITQLRARRSELNSLALALQIGFLKMTGRSLNSVEIVPVAVLEYLGHQLKCTPPHIASIRAFYRRRRTLFDHQAAAMQFLGRTHASEHAERSLTSWLRREATAIFDTDKLMASMRSWLVDHHYILPRERTIRRQVTAARRRQELSLSRQIKAVVPDELRDVWVTRLLAEAEPEGVTYLEWLRVTPATKAAKALEEQLAKIKFLKELGADKLILDDLPLSGMEHFGKRIMTRKPGALAALKEPHKTTEIACFLRLCLLRLTDAALTLLDHQIAAAWRGAKERADESQNGKLRRFRVLLGALTHLASDEALGIAELRSRLQSLIAPFESDRQATQVALIRQELAQQSKELDRLLRAARGTSLTLPSDHKITEAFATLDNLADQSSSILPAGTANPFGPSWQNLVDQSDRKAALDCFRAATVMLLKRALRNRSVTVGHSLSYVAPEDKLIPIKLWERDRNRFLRDLSMPASAEKYLQKLEAGLTAGLAAIAEAVEAGTVAIDSDAIRLPRRKPAPKNPHIDQTRRTIMEAIGSAQLSQIMIEIDSLTRFSWTLLGRPARSEQELITLYASLLALGSDLSIAELARMIPAVNADSLGQMVLKLEADNRLRTANDVVMRFMREHRIASLWGRGLFASADMMSLEATRYLWSARLDPRRRTYAVGTYAHVLDQWGILYDQPIVLNRRQAGAAIEGALRQQQVDRLERVAVDTHGFTHFAMTLAKVTGFDLCPRIAKLKKRKLYLPKGFTNIPDVLKPVVAAEPVSRKVIVKGWDGLMRLGTSVKKGWYPATEALDRYGSAARGDPVFDAGDSLGKLLRTLYLCDFLGNPVFRYEILDLLNQGEAVHSLQRAIHDGTIPAKHGRTNEQLMAISGALTLLANIIMSWNTHHIELTANASHVVPSDDILKHIAPLGYEHINMRGIVSFDIGENQTNLLGLSENTLIIGQFAPRS